MTHQQAHFPLYNCDWLNNITSFNFDRGGSQITVAEVFHSQSMSLAISDVAATNGLIVLCQFE